MHKVSRLLWFQFGLCLLISLTLFALSGRREAISAFAGGMVAFLPALLFARNVFRYQGARSARQIANSMYVGEGLKIIVSVALFILVFVFYKVAPLTFFLTYIAVVLSHWFAPLIIANKQK